jgi:hypothetical protein
MTLLRVALACGLALAGVTSSLAQEADNSCIVAGRLSDEGRWAPRMEGVELLGQDGRPIASADKQALSGVRQVRLSAPALLSRCDGNYQLALGPEVPGGKPDAKAPVAKIGPGVLQVEAVSYPKLRRGGELVELRLTVPPGPAQRVTVLTR